MGNLKSAGRVIILRAYFIIKFWLGNVNVFPRLISNFLNNRTKNYITVACLIKNVELPTSTLRPRTSKIPAQLINRCIKHLKCNRLSWSKNLNYLKYNNFSWSKNLNYLKYNRLSSNLIKIICFVEAARFTHVEQWGNRNFINFNSLS